ncbi:hypothetical protein [Mycobacterium sp. SM1]
MRRNITELRGLEPAAVAEVAATGTPLPNALPPRRQPPKTVAPLCRPPR